MRIKSTTFKHLLLYIFAFSIIYQSGSVRAALFGTGWMFQITRMLVLVLPVVLILSYGLTRRGLCFMAAALGAGLTLISINCCLYPAGLITLVYKFVLFTIIGGMCIGLQKSEVDLYEYFYKVILVIASISLVFFLGVEIGGLTLPYSLVQNNISIKLFLFRGKIQGKAGLKNRNSFVQFFVG